MTAMGAGPFLAVLLFLGAGLVFWLGWRRTL